jgi:hypothetical protein
MTKRPAACVATGHDEGMDARQPTCNTAPMGDIMRKIRTMLAGVALAATLGSPAQAADHIATDTCATRGEWQRVHQDMRLVRVERLIGGAGRVVLAERLPDGTRGMWVEWRRCRGGTVGAGFDNFDTGRSAGDPWYSFEPFVRVAKRTGWGR